MDNEPFEPSLYTRSPTLTIASAIVLAQALVAACPPHMPAVVKKACDHLGLVGDAAQQAWAERKRQSGSQPEESSRAIDQEADGGWSSLRSRLVAYAGLPANHFPKARRAQELVDTLFGDGGLGFLREAYVVQWSTMNVLLKRIDDEGLAPDIDTLAGPEFLQHIRHVHPRYRAMVRATLQRETGQQNLLDHVRLIQRAIVSYATRVCATVEDDDPATVETARDALAAIAKMRMLAANRRDSGESEPTPMPVTLPVHGLTTRTPPKTGGPPKSGEAPKSDEQPKAGDE